MVGDHFQLRDSGPYAIIFMNVRVIITVAMVMMKWDSGPCEIYL
jgi:hypothetical protein